MTLGALQVLSGPSSLVPSMFMKRIKWFVILLTLMVIGTGRASPSPPPQSFIDIIQAIPINLTSTLGDTTAWALLRDGNFNLASAYLLAKGLNALNLPTFTSNWIWKMKVPQKIIIFLWLCSHNSVPVREVLGSRGLTLDQVCPLCHSQVESINHLLKYCPFAVSFWN